VGGMDGSAHAFWFPWHVFWLPWHAFWFPWHAWHHSVNVPTLLPRAFLLLALSHHHTTTTVQAWSAGGSNPELCQASGSETKSMDFESASGRGSGRGGGDEKTDGDRGSRDGPRGGAW
jgi:hypothetical protein